MNASTNNQTNNRKKIYSLIIYLLLFVAIAIFIYKYKNDFLNLKFDNCNYVLLLPLATLMILLQISNGLLNNFWYRILGVTLTTKEWFGLSVINGLGNYLLPLRGGSLSNAIYLKKQHNFTYTNFLNIFAATNLIVFWANSIFGLLSVLLIYLFYNQFSWLVFVIFFNMFIAFTIIFCGPDLSNFSVENKFTRALKGWSEIKKHRLAIMQTLLMATINTLLISLMTFLEFRLLGVQASLQQAFFLSIFSSFAQLLSITPGNLGIREGFMLYAGTVIGIPAVEIVAISAIDRVLMFLLTLPLGFYFVRFLLSKLRNN
ncbi:MAG: flippase-like domain-containing protein [Oligoflexia bacterium]|nr:flippase-like domain-containing protein [Oligoflexia bacterium]